MASATTLSVSHVCNDSECNDGDEDVIKNQVEEVSKIKSENVGRCRVIEDSGDYKYILTIQPENFDATIKFQLRASYPSVIPDLSVRSSSLKPDQLMDLKNSLLTKAKELIGSQMIEELMKHAYFKLLGYGLKSGKISKIDDHKFISDSNSKKKIKKKSKIKYSEEIDEEKKKPMKTADDVIKRILWDEHLDKDDFLVGYIDRFLGLQEKYFTAFSWEDLASVDYNVLAVPHHRIQYFKYKTVKVWDKPRRIDDVFGSTEDGKTIDIVMKEFQERELRLRSEAGSEDISAQEEEKKSDEPSSGESDEESDDDDIIITISQSVNIGSKDNDSKSKSQNQEENNDGENADASNSDYNPYWRDKLRPNYFICVRITDPCIIDRVGEVQDHFLTKEPLLGECCIPGASLHVTLCTIGLDTAQQLVNCINSLNKMKSDLKSQLPKSVLRLHGVSQFYNRVVYAKVNYSDDFMNFCNVLKLNLREAGIDIRDGYEFIPHMTLLKTSRPVSKLRGTKNINPSLFEPFLQQHFGEQKISSIHLCSMSTERRDDGFYMTPLELELL